VNETIPASKAASCAEVSMPFASPDPFIWNMAQHQQLFPEVLSLAEEGVEVVERVPDAVPPNPHNRGHLATTARRAGHWVEAL
jgi:hypothetical protein